MIARNRKNKPRGMVMKALLIGILVFYAAASVAAFIVYGADKFKAKRGMWRIPEKVLLLLSFFGGAVGALAGMLVFRHKTRHWYFWFLGIVGLLWQAALAAGLAFAL